MVSKRFLMVPDDSSAARIPRPGATIALATLLSSVRFIEPLLSSSPGDARLCFQDFDARQRLALEPFEKCAAGGRHISEPAADTGRIECRHRIAATGHRDEMVRLGELGRRLGHLDRAVVERLDLEGA